MKLNWIIILGFFLVAHVGRTQVVLPPSSEYDDPYTYYRDCVSQNGDEGSSACEIQTGSLFPSEEKEVEALSLQQNDTGAVELSE